MIKKLVIALALSALMLPALASTPEALYTVTVDGKTVNVIELKEVKHCGSRHHWWQVWAKTEDYHVYRTLEDYDTVLNPAQYKAVKSQLKNVPDNRDYEKRYPLRSECQHDINTALGIAVTAAQFAK